MASIEKISKKELELYILELQQYIAKELVSRVNDKALRSSNPKTPPPPPR